MNAEAFCGHPLPPPQGHNTPPEPTAYELARDRIEDLWGEALLWMDGAKVDSQEMADGIANLLAELRKAEKDADAARKAEAEPFDLGKAEVQAKYRPLLTKTEQASKACKAAVAPWLQAKAEAIEAKAREAREEAERKTREAQEAIRAADVANLTERAAAEVLVKAAKRAESAAIKSARETATAGGFGGRAVGLRRTVKPKIVDEIAALRWAWKAYPENMLCTVLILAEKEIRAGKREIPGFDIQEEVSAV